MCIRDRRASVLEAQVRGCNRTSSLAGLRKAASLGPMPQPKEAATTVVSFIAAPFVSETCGLSSGSALKRLGFLQLGLPPRLVFRLPPS
eukprot:12575011-Alexandrium_andersonii.AAC.1